jgi:pimeloyl-ACP methyl ester carboxylesterase
MSKRNVLLASLLLGGAPLLPCSGLHGQTGTAAVNGVSLPYEITGSGNPLVLIHGWAVHRGFWDTDVERLAQQHTVIRYDRRGFGESTGKPDLTADPADLKAMLESLGYSRAHIMGHSQGAAVALTFAVRYPEMVDALVLFGAPPPAGFGLPPGGDGPPIAQWVAIGKAQGVDSLKMAIGAWAARQFGGAPDEMMQRGGALLDSYTGLDLIDPDPPLNLVEPARADELQAVKAPTLVIHGQYEMPYFRVVAHALTYGIPGARKAVIPGGGHTVNWPEPERFAAEVLRFLREAEEDRDGS